MKPRSARVDHVRVAVVGGGVAGCAAAIALRRAGITDVLVLEASAKGRARVGETIPPDARRLLGRLGLAAAFDLEGHAPCYGSASCWGAEELGYNDHLVHPLSHGYHLDRQRFDAWLGRCADSAGAARLVGARVTGIARQGDGWRLTIRPHGERAASCATEVTAEVVVDATGSMSSIGRRLGAQRLEHDRLTYLSCTLTPQPDSPRSGQTWLEATRDGWWYAAQLPDGRYTLAIATDPEVIEHKRLCSIDGFFRAFADTIHLRMHLEHMSPCAEHPAARVASSSLLGPPAGAGWLAVGDAAASYDPICARGIHKAMEDSLRAAQAVRGHLAGDDTAIAAFARHSIVAFRAYLEQRAYLYAQESRWPEALFWGRRRSRRSLLSPRHRRGESSVRNQATIGA